MKVHIKIVSLAIFICFLLSFETYSDPQINADIVDFQAPDDSIYNTLQNLLIDTKEGLDKANIYKSLAELAQIKLDFQSALTFYDSALAQAEMTDSIFLINEIKRGKGVLFANWGKYAESLSIFNEILQEYRELPLSIIARVHYNIGNVFTKLKRWNDAKLSYQKSIALITEDTTKALNTINLQHNMAVMYLQRGDLDSAGIWFKTLFKTEKKWKLETPPVNAFTNYSLWLIKKGKLDSAKFYLDSATNVRRQKGDELGLSFSYRAYGEYFYQTNQFDLALLALNAAEKRALKHDNWGLLGEITFLRSQIHKSLKNYELALQLSDEYLRIQERLNDQINDDIYSILNNSMDRINASFEKQLLLDKTLMMEKQNEIDRQRLKYLIVIIVLASIIMIILLLQLRKRQDRNRILEGLVAERTSQIEEQLRELEIKNEDLKKTTKELNRFLYSASHDLRAPIASMLGLINISKITNNIEELQQYQLLHEKALNKLDLVIRGLNDFTIHKRKEMYLEPVNLNRLFDEVLEDFKYYPLHVPMQVAKTLDPDLVFVTDQIRFRMVIRNLIQNAYKYANRNQPNPRLEISAKVKPNGELNIVISDNGIGIDSTYHEKVFDMFFRANAEYSGSGLGLYISKEIILSLAGNIRMDSQLGLGTTFYINLPQIKDEVAV